MQKAKNDFTKIIDKRNNASNWFQSQYNIYTDTIFRLEQRLREFDDEIRRYLPIYQYQASNHDLVWRVPEEILIEYLKLQQIVFLKKILVLNFKLNGNKEGWPKY